MDKFKKVTAVILAIVVAFALLFWLIVGLIRGAVALEQLPKHETHDGFDEWDPERSRIVGDVRELIKKDILTEFPCTDGDYHVDRYESFMMKNWTYRSLVWLTYDDPDVYAAAKASRFDPSRFPGWLEVVPFEGPAVYGFAFCYVGENDPFPENVSVFGFNDQTKTLVFVGFWGGGKKEDPHIEAGSTDFAGFLDHYFGEWFDWEAGDRAPS